ncbi:PDR/VanB family oxidoreductase [Variovorax guangxiensis]|uniref:PDR/VanB family oxidoreductase n=1 Tax=Variovorax guangxiensis TaxID=1775474 RepID=UPI00285CAFD7|nr:PDR/VanB family oxidoreductase [Variovorax guangxiensis]MDR6858681.1 vanillate O-demethylase ferredoxin subunit [Variovorax guangxiensis]
MQTVRVATVRRETPEIISLELVAQEGEQLARAAPGAHIDVAIDAPAGGGHPPLRQYSLCQGPDEAKLYRIGVKREANSRGGSEWLHQSVNAGDLLQIGKPRNNFPLTDAAGFQLLVAGGIGITPMLGMALHLAAKGAPFRLEYFVRSMEHAAFASLLQGDAFRDNVRFHVGVPGDQLEKVASGLFGTRPAEDAHLYVCGPAPFIGVVERVAERAWPADAVHHEYFGAAAGQQAADGSFRIRLARSGRELLVPAGVPIIAVLEEAGVPVETSCRQGACGTCLVNVLEGTPDHRDSFLLPDEQKEGHCLMTCVSRSLSPTLVLDL